MKQSIDEVIEFFKEKILEISKPIKILLIGSNGRKREEGNECDFDNDFDIITNVSHFYLTL